MAGDSRKEDSPTLRQRLHSATGDRHAEAEALEERAGRDVDGHAAEVAVRHAHGDIEAPNVPKSESAEQHDLATTADLRAVEEESES
jgi:hypothetical protein